MRDGTKIMDFDNAAAILECNYRCSESSLIYGLHEECIFSSKYFWDYYDSVLTLAKDALISGKNIEIKTVLQ